MLTHERFTADLKVCITRIMICRLCVEWSHDVSAGVVCAGWSQRVAEDYMAYLEALLAIFSGVAVAISGVSAVVVDGNRR